MPFNGSGTFTPATSPSPAYPAVTGATIEAAQFNTIVVDIATGLTNTITRDGQGATTADQAMGTYKHTGVGDGVARTQYPSIGQIQDGVAVKITSVSGTNTIIATAPFSMAAYTTGMLFEFVAAGANTGVTTINLNSIGAKQITKQGATALVANDILASMACVIYYDGTQFQLINPAVAGSYQPLDTTLGALAGLDVSVGLVEQTGADTFTKRTIGTASGNVPLNSDIYGKQTVWIPAGAMTSRTTTGAAARTAETATNKVMIKTLDFDTAADEHAQFSIRMPKGWNEGTLTFTPVWSHAATTTNFGVVWFLQAVAVSNDDTLEVAFGTAVSSTDTGGTTNDAYVGPASSAMTVAGTPAEGDLVVFQIYRDVSDAGDTLAVDARLHGVTINYTTNALNDN